METRAALMSSISMRLALGSPSRIEIELINAARVSIFAEATDDVPRALRTEPATVDIRAGSGSSGRAAYSVMPVERGDARFGRVFLRYQTLLRLAEPSTSADLTQTA